MLNELVIELALQPDQSCLSASLSASQSGFAPQTKADLNNRGWGLRGLKMLQEQSRALGFQEQRLALRGRMMLQEQCRGLGFQEEPTKIVALLGEQARQGS
jgi:hypothetical protein